ncbi:MAG: tryptophan synthase subunit alpha [Gemmatimonadota bacterium]
MADLGRRLTLTVDGGRKLLLPFLTAGYPDPATTTRALAGLADAGADAIELGVPFSDPLADGPVIAAASERALAGGLTLEGTLRLASACPPDGPPLVLFTYLNPLHARGFPRAAADIRAVGIAAVLVADLPFDEGRDVRAALEDEGLPLVPLAAPTTPEARLRALAREARGFVYLIARTGVTGTGADSDRRLADRVRVLREGTGLAIVIGFGIGDVEAARRAAAVGDGIVVGSAFVERLGRDGVEAAVEWVGTLRRALDAG